MEETKGDKESAEQTTEGRPKREAQVTDYRAFNRTGRTGRVAEAIQRIETPEKTDNSTLDDNTLENQGRSTPKAKRALEEDNQPVQHITTSTETSPHPDSEMSELEQLRKELQKQQDLNAQLETEMEAMRLRSQIQAEKMKQQEWQVARDRLEQEQALAAQRHEETLKKLKEVKTDDVPDNPSVQFLKEKLAELTGEEHPKINLEAQAKAKKQQEVADQLQALMKQQEDIAQAARKITTGYDSEPRIQEMLEKLQTPTPKAHEPQKDEQTKLMEHLLNTLQGKETESQISKQKEVLRQFLIDSNKTTTAGGATTLKPELLKKLTGEGDTFNMSEWLAKLNRRGSDEARCEVCTEDCKQHKKSGMLDKATANIQHKEIWPQKNLLEDWADEDLDFKNMQFEHYVAGEVRTIETCTEPAQILGRLKLLRRMSYAKLRGYDWTIIRKMYAAILRSIETKENTWETNFDRYEAILYRRPPKKDDRPIPSQSTGPIKKWFCRDWNKGNCTKTAPHKAWFGTGSNATQRTVLHMCAVCYMKDKAQRDHAEGQDTCPHKDA